MIYKNSADGNSINDGFRDTLSYADAARIVRAVNAHEELVASLKMAAPYACSMLCPSVKKTGTEWTHSNTCMAITAALAKAEGQS